MGQPDLRGRRIGTTTLPHLSPRQATLEGAEICLRSNSYLALKNVTCDYHEGVLTLRGCLPTYYLKQIAQTAVAQVVGVERVVNEIEVISASR